MHFWVASSATCRRTCSLRRCWGCSCWDRLARAVVHRMLSEAQAAAVDTGAALAPAALELAVEGEADLAPIGGMRGSFAEPLSLPLVAFATLGAFLLLLGVLTFSRITCAVARACAAVSVPSAYLSRARVPVVPAAWC